MKNQIKKIIQQLYAADGENTGGADAASLSAPLLIHDVLGGFTTIKTFMRDKVKSNNN